MMYRSPVQLAEEVANAVRRLRWTPQSGDALIVRIEENGVDTRVLDDTELDTLCKERKRP